MGQVYRQYVNAAIRSDDDYIDKAEEYYRKVFAMNPDSAAGHELLGQVRLAQGQTAESTRSFKRALAIRPDSVLALTELGRVYEQSGYHGEARSVFHKAVALDPLSAIAQSALLYNELFAGHREVVEREAPEVISSFPKFPYIRFLYALSLIQSRQLEKALEVLGAGSEEETPTIAGRQCNFLKLALQGKAFRGGSMCGRETHGPRPEGGMVVLHHGRMLCLHR